MAEEITNKKGLSEDPKNITSDIGFMRILSEKEKFYTCIYDHPNFTRKQLGEAMLFCISVSSVIPVTSENNQNNSNNKNNKITTSKGELSLLLNRLNVYVNRALEKGDILADKSENEHKYVLSVSGKAFVIDKYLLYRNNISKEVSVQQAQSDIQTMIDVFEEYFNSGTDLSKSIVGISVRDLANFDYKLADALLDEPKDTLTCAKIALENMEYIGKHVILHSVPQSIIIPITKTRKTKLYKLIALEGEVVSRSQSNFIINSIRFECPGCGNSFVVIQSDQAVREPTKCGCGRKGKFRVLSKDMSDYLKISVRDLYEKLPPNTVPEEIPCMMRNDLYDFASINDGDRIRVIGCMIDIPVTKRNGMQSIECNKAFEVLGIEYLNPKYNSQLIAEEDIEKFAEIRKEPFVFVNDLFFKDLSSVDIQTKVLLVAYFSEASILSVGDPGTGKSEMMKRMINYAIKGKIAQVQGSLSSTAGIMGSASKNEFTGKYSLSGGILRPMHPKGFVGLDELNRDKDFEIQSALLGIMNDRRLNIHKSNIDIDISCDVTVWATGNPIAGHYDTSKYEYDNFGILHPLWNRFDIVLYYNSAFDENRIVDYLKNNVTVFEPDSERIKLFRSYWLYASMLDVVLSDEDFERLEIVTKALNIRRNEGFRRINTIKRLLTGVCRLYHRTHPIKEDFQLLTDMILELKDAKLLFINEHNEGVQ